MDETWKSICGVLRGCEADLKEGGLKNSEMG